MGARSSFISSIVVILICSLCFGITGLTDSQDAVILGVLKSAWKNTPPNWTGSDPCGSQWDGINCTDSRVTSLTLSTMELEGSLPTEIGYLIGLKTLDLSYNKGLKGPIPSSLGKLIHLETLAMIGCAFTGRIPSELGNLQKLDFLALNSNNFSGPIPPSLGKLAELTWFDLSDNKFSGPLPISSETQSGLDNLLKARHFHFNKNKLSGSIPPSLFCSEMQLIHLLFDDNNFEGPIPSTLGLVQTLVVVRLDRNSLSGKVPSDISNLGNISELNLSNNNLEGSVPDLSNLTNLQYVDLSNNSFDPSEAPRWFTRLRLLVTLNMENGRLMGQFPSEVLDLPDLQTLGLRNNSFNGTLQIDPEVTGHLQLIDLRSNQISNAQPPPKGLNLLLAENPVCESGSALSNTEPCQPYNAYNEGESYKTVSADCERSSCSGELEPNPKTCQCQQPYCGQLQFWAPISSDLTNASRFQLLEDKLQTGLRSVSAVSLCCLHFDNNDYLVMDVKIFPSNVKYFARWDVMTIGFLLGAQICRLDEFGPYIFEAQGYFVGTSKSNSLSSTAIIGIAVGAAVLAVAIVGTGIYASRQKRRADEIIELDKPFAVTASRRTSGQHSEDIPKLKGARWFSFAEIRKATNNFSETNEIGAGGYGKVYKALVPSSGGHEMVAIKRAQEGSLQGATEFKNEIELLSRVHHTNLVGLVGFCFEQGEQMLVYEYISNGTLRENLSGRTGILLDWRRRIQIAVGSARGLTYLHELANPPIIHRDVKSSNILLDEYLTAKVADFGLSKLVAGGGADAGGKSHVSTQVKGTFGYVDPEYYMTEQLSDKSDVYSFGVVLLELITARPPIRQRKHIVAEVKRTLDMGGISAFWHQLMDPFLRDSSAILTGLESFVNLALQCVDDVGAHRPSMRDVAKELESIADMELAGSDHSKSSSGLESVNRNQAGHHLYADEATPQNSKSLFDYSGADTMPTAVEPK